MIVATAGHIDHGKTSLIRALTGVETDTLREERERGISIDLGFAWWRPQGSPPIGFVDVPGHERFVRNMLAGVSGIDAALLVVAADDGVMPQTREHLQILDLLGVASGVVAITKRDRVDAARVDAVRRDVERLIERSTLRAAPMLAVSSVTGEGVEPLARLLESAAHAARAAPSGERLFRMAVDRVFTRAGHGTVATGYLRDGALATGARIAVFPSGAPARVRSLQVAGADVERVSAGQRCAVALAGVQAAELGRGAWLVDPEFPAAADQFHASVSVLATETHALRDLARVHLHHGTGSTTARIKTLHHGPIEPGASATCRLQLDHPACMLNGDRFIVRDASATRTIGGGTVLAPVFRERDRAWVTTMLPRLHDGDAGTAVAAALAGETGEVDLARIARTFGLPLERVARIAADGGGLACAAAPTLAVHGRVLERIATALAARLAALHAAQPEAAGFAPLQLAREVAPQASRPVFAQALRGLVDAGTLRWRGPLVALAAHVPQVSRRDAQLWERILPRLTESTVSPPAVRVLARELGMTADDLTALLQRKCRDGEAWMIVEGRFFPRASVSVLAATAAELSAACAPAGGFKAAQYRDRIGVGRGLAIHILEFFDRVGVTHRRGELRHVRSGYALVVGEGRPLPRPAAQAAGQEVAHE